MTKGLMSVLGLVVALSSSADASPIVVVMDSGSGAANIAGATVSGNPITYSKLPFWSTTGFTDVKDITGATTTVDVRVGVSGIGSVPNVLTSTPALAGVAATLFPDDARNVGVYTTSATDYITLVFSGLTSGVAYKLDTFALRDGTASNRVAEYLATGQNTVGPVVGVSCNQNSSTVTQLSGVLPDANNQIVLSWRLWSGSSGSGAMNAVQISEVPEPATLSLLGLGGLAVLTRRRRA